MSNRKQARSSVESPRQLVTEITASIVIGAVLTTAMLIGYAFLFERYVLPRLMMPGEGMLTTGSQFACCSMPMSAVLGGGIGASIALARFSHWFWSGIVGLFVHLSIGSVVYELWNSSIRRYGPNPSDVLLYYPLLFASSAGLVSAFACFIIACVRARVSSLNDHREQKRE